MSPREDLFIDPFHRRLAASLRRWMMDFELVSGPAAATEIAAVASTFARCCFPPGTAFNDYAVGGRWLAFQLVLRDLDRWQLHHLLDDLIRVLEGEGRDDDPPIARALDDLLAPLQSRPRDGFQLLISLRRFFFALQERWRLDVDRLTPELCQELREKTSGVEVWTGLLAILCHIHLTNEEWHRTREIVRQASRVVSLGHDLAGLEGDLTSVEPRPNRVLVHQRRGLAATLDEAVAQIVELCNEQARQLASAHAELRLYERCDLRRFLDALLGTVRGSTQAARRLAGRRCRDFGMARLEDVVPARADRQRADAIGSVGAARRPQSSPVLRFRPRESGQIWLRDAGLPRRTGSGNPRARDSEQLRFTDSGRLVWQTSSGSAGSAG